MKLYIIGDGNHTRRRIDFLLLTDRLDELTKFSENLKTAISSMKEIFEGEMHGRCIVAAGDDLVVELEAECFSPSVLRKLESLYRERTGCTIAFGYGESIGAAILDLRLKKAHT
jgi:hypothetical protein